MREIKRYKRAVRRAYRKNTRRAWERERDAWVALVQKFGFHGA